MLPEFLKIIFEIPYVQIIFQSKSMKPYKFIGDGVFWPPKNEWAIRRFMAVIKNNLAKGRIPIRSPWLNFVKLR